MFGSLILTCFIAQERDLESELGDDYILDLQSKNPFSTDSRQYQGNS